MWLRSHFPEVTLKDRARGLGEQWRLVVRLTVATTSAWLIATHLLGHDQAFFAPIAAVIVTLGGGSNLRARTMLELVLGVALGVLAAELIILAVGRGGWQIAAAVAIATALGLFSRIGGLATIQAVNSAILIVTIIPPASQGDPALTRFLDALVGGFVGLCFLILIPRNAVRDLDRDVQKMLTTLAATLRRIGEALRQQDGRLAQVALDEARSTQAIIDVAGATARRAIETARFAPSRRRQREHLDLYVTAMRDIDHALRNERVLARRVRAVVRRGEAVPVPMSSAIDALVTAVEFFADDLSEQEGFIEAQNALVDAARQASSALSESPTMQAAAIAVQIRSLAADLLFASGVTVDELDRLYDFD